MDPRRVAYCVIRESSDCYVEIVFGTSSSKHLAGFSARFVRAKYVMDRVGDMPGTVKYVWARLPYGRQAFTPENYDEEDDDE